VEVLPIQKKRKWNMSLDINSLTIGLVIGTAIGAVITGFFRKMGEDAYGSAKKIISREQKFVEVDRRYEPDTSDGASLSWVSEAKLYEYKNFGFKFRVIDNQKQGCYRITHDGLSTYKEYLMIKPE
jgi:hypothetical protein